MATPHGQTQRKEVLQCSLMLGVFHGHPEAVKEAGACLKEHFSSTKSSGPQVLDFRIAKESQWKPFKRIPKKLEELSKTHSPLMLAVERGNVEIVQKLIDLDASMAYKNKDGLSALHIACSKRMKDVAGLILEKAETQRFFCTLQKKKKKKGAAVAASTDEVKEMRNDCEVLLNAKERPQGWTALMYSAKQGDLETIKVLAKYDFLKLDVKNKKQHNVFHILAREPTTVREDGEEEVGEREEERRTKRLGQQLDCMRYLFSLREEHKDLLLTSDKENRSLLHQLCCSGNLLMLQWLLETFPELNNSESLNQESKLGYTPLLLACQYSKYEIVKFLTEEPVKSLVDIKACCHRNKRESEDVRQNGLHIAAIRNDVKVTKQLIKAECPLDECDLNGNTILHVAFKRANFAVAREIRRHSEELDTHRNNEGKLPVELEEEIVIPPEIKKRGEEAIRIFKEALDDGKKKIPYCSMLILGKESMGKTSLYRQLVGKNFDKHLKSTEGIDNTTVDTVDRRNVDINKWEEKEDPDVGEQFIEALAGEFAGKYNKPSVKGKGPEPVTEQDLLKRIRQVKTDIEADQAKALERLVAALSSSPPVQPVFPPIHHPPFPPPASALPVQPPAPKRSRMEPEASAPPPQPISQPVLEKKPTKPPPSAPPKPAAVKPPTPPPSPSPPPEEDEHSSSSSDVDDATDAASPRAAPPPAAAGLLNRRQSSRLNQIVRGKQVAVKKQLPLVLNALDFAGQKMYRPLHHCFISRRAVYIVVFKIPDMLKFIEDRSLVKYDPMEEILYWVQSIHAHIYPPDPAIKREDEAINRVILVGTHRGVPECLFECFTDPSAVQKECYPDDLKKIDDLIKKELIKKKDCNTVKHILPVKSCGSPCNYFIPVENSIDKLVKGKAYLEASGTKYLQRLIESMSDAASKKLPFLNELHPIKWLKFIDRLKAEERAKRYRSDKSQVMKIEDVKKLAQKSGITDPDQQDLALKFFHDTGKIVYLKYLPTLFLTAEEKKELDDLVVLQPHWLISVMKKIVELNSTEKTLHVGLNKIVVLEEEGVADVEVLQESWKDFLTEDTQIRQLCLILQAHCLIFPIQSTSSVPSVAAADEEESSNQSTSAENGDSIMQRFIIPCKLPDKPPEEEFETATFYFDFCQFLPDEIYHRLICLAIAKADPEEHKYSSTKCVFYRLYDTNWVMELEKGKHRLKISVNIEDVKDPSRFIRFIHQDCLSKICDDSKLQGLKYYGGPLGVCHGNVLRFVKYENGEVYEEEGTKSKCLKCCKKFDVNATLSAQVSPPEPPVLDVKLDRNSLRNVFDQVKAIAGKWKKLGLYLSLDPGKLNTIEKDRDNCEDRLIEALFEWLAGNGGKCTLEFLRSALTQIGESGLAKNIKL